MAKFTTKKVASAERYDVLLDGFAIGFVQPVANGAYWWAHAEVGEAEPYDADGETVEEALAVLTVIATKPHATH